jgi:hypothetical protein
MLRWISTAHLTASTTLAKLNQHAVAHELDQPAIGFGNLWINEMFAGGPQARQGVRLIDLHKVAITNDICREYGGELPLHEALQTSGKIQSKIGHWPIET